MADETVYRRPRAMCVAEAATLEKGVAALAYFLSKPDRDALTVVVSVKVADQQSISGSKRRLWMEELGSFTQVDSGGS